MAQDMHVVQKKTQSLWSTEPEVSEQMVVELSDEQFEEVTGGLGTTLSGMKGVFQYARGHQEASLGESLLAAVGKGRSAGYSAANDGFKGAGGVQDYLRKVNKGTVHSSLSKVIWF